jgi:hypothetical protein
MTEQEWRACIDPQRMLKFLQGTGWRSERKLRLFIIAVTRRVWSLVTNEQFRLAVEIAEQFADRLVNQGQLYAALGEDTDSYDWLGGVGDLAYHACRRKRGRGRGPSLPPSLSLRSPAISIVGPRRRLAYLEEQGHSKASPGHLQQPIL